MNIKQQKGLLLSQLYAPYLGCSLCPLGNLGRKNVVFGSGNPDAKMLLIGEGPGKDEDEQGLPFVGKSGKFLRKILESIGLSADDVYIANVVKCRPPNNRTPSKEEASICKETLLDKQIQIIAPKVICTLGSSALNALLGNKSSISKMRGIFTFYKEITLLPTYHPAYILRDRKKLPLLAQDLQAAFNKCMARSEFQENPLKETVSL